MLVITTRKGLFYNYDKDTWHKDIKDATLFKHYELEILIELVENQDQDLEIRDTFAIQVILHSNYAKSERIDKFLS